MTWVEGAAGSAYDLDNLPYGVFSTPGTEPRVGVRIGDFVMEASAVAALGGDTGEGPHLAPVWAQPGLDPFLAMGRTVWDIAREWLVEVLGNDVHRERVEPLLVPLADVTMHLPFEVADYVDFYASEQHATNVGRIFRPDGDALTPNWKHLPIGYHGRAGTVVVSGTDVRRPSGQRKAPTRTPPTFGPSRRLDIEAELGFVVGGASALGELGADVGVRRPRVRGDAAQRLVGTRHPGLGVRPARPRSSASRSRPRSARGSPRSRHSSRPRAWTCRARTRLRWTTCGSRSRRATTSPSRSC